MNQAEGLITQLTTIYRDTSAQAMAAKIILELLIDRNYVRKFFYRSDTSYIFNDFSIIKLSEGAQKISVFHVELEVNSHSDES